MFWPIREPATTLKVPPMKNNSDDGSDQPKATAPPETGDRFDIELVEWLASHRGEWSGVPLNCSPQ